MGAVLSLAAIVAAVSINRVGAGPNGQLSILLLGTDQRPDERGGDPGRTDTMILVVIDRTGTRSHLVSIPRDLWVSVPGHGEGRINTAYRSGELSRPGSGGALAERTVSAALGVPVDRYVLVDMSAVTHVVNALGGIDVVAPNEIIDADFPTDDFGARRLIIPAGPLHMDGQTALAYARTRHADDDFARMARQQQVLAAVRARATDRTNLARIPALMSTMSNVTKSDLTPAEIGWLISHAQTLSEERTRRLVIGPELATPITGADGAYLLKPRESLSVAVAGFLAGAS
ncbi:MAG: cell envelope-related transcriptional attenuator [Chloroflexi bacterium]|nr:cell envelope-related transcriptional attenuator [Chloroflexota bacterium]